MNDAIANSSKLGKVVKIRGKLRRMPTEYIHRDIFASVDESKVYREIIVENIFEVPNPNEELFIWTEILKLNQLDYNKVPESACKYMEERLKVLNKNTTTNSSSSSSNSSSVT